jgi:cytochrome b subunit of formate dehydrogenase
MTRQNTFSTRTRVNWLIDFAVFVGGLLSALTGSYFLYLPSGGYRSGLNPAYGAVILFERATWADLHTWAGVLMIAAALVHFSIHWAWAKTMARRAVKWLRGRGPHMSSGAKLNLAVDVVVALSFLVTAASGIVFLFAPTGGYQGGRNPGWEMGFPLFSRTTWDLIHTWAGVTLISAAAIHFALHWGWVSKVTERLARSLWGRPAPSRPTLAADA